MEGVLVPIHRVGGVYDGRVRPLQTSFLSCLCEMNLGICHTKGHKITENEYCQCIIAPQKAQSGKTNFSKFTIHTQTHAEGPKTTTTTARLLGCFVECGIYTLANSGAGVVSKLGVTTGYALIDFVVVGAHDPQPQRMFTVLEIVLCCFCSRSDFSELSELHFHPSLARRFNSITFSLSSLPRRLWLCRVPLEISVRPYSHLSSKVILRGTYSFRHSDLGKLTAEIVISCYIYRCIWTFLELESSGMVPRNRGRFKMQIRHGKVHSHNVIFQRKGK